MQNKAIEARLKGLSILVVDGNAFTRRLTRTMLTNLGAKTVIEASDGLAALEAIRTGDPDVMFLDWDMPVLDGMEVMRIVRTPGMFPRPNIPVIMLTGHSQRSFVLEAMKRGVHEFLLKPASPKALRDRLMSVMMRPRRMVKMGEHYVPEPRRVPTQRELARMV